MERPRPQPRRADADGSIHQPAGPGRRSAAVQHGQAAAWDQLAQLAGLNRSATGLVLLSALQVGGRVPTRPEIVAVDAVPLLKIQQLQAANLTQVTTWDHLRQLVVLTQSAANTIARANAPKAGIRPSLAQVVSIDRFNNAEVLAVGNVPGVNSWAATEQAITQLPVLLQRIANSMDGTLNGDLAEIRNTLGNNNIDLWHYKAVLVDVDCPQLGAANGQDAALPAGVQRDIMAMFFANATAYNACFDGASRLARRIQGRCCAASRITISARSAMSPRTSSPWSRAARNNSVQTRINGAAQMNWNAAGIALLQKSNPPHGAYDQIKDPMTVYWTAAPLATPLLAERIVIALSAMPSVAAPREQSCVTRDL